MRMRSGPHVVCATVAMMTGVPIFRAQPVLALPPAGSTERRQDDSSAASATRGERLAPFACRILKRPS